MAKVPAVPISALDAIQDRNVYTVLRAITDMLNVRNGQTGDSDNAFVTRAEIGNLRAGGGSIVGVPGAQQSQGFTFPTIQPSDIARVINDLQAQIIESPLFKALGERIERVDSKGSSVVASLQEERTTRETAVSALAQSLDTLEATVGSQSVALQQEAQTRADADGNIMGKYSVKIDANGYVSGFGLISTANNSTPFSDFTVRADRFSIGSPSGPGVPARVPFIVVTTTQIVNGYTVPPGVYIDAAAIAAASIGEAQIKFAAIRRAHIQTAAIGSAQIEDAAITFAKIGTAEVDTLSIRGDAVTVPRASINGGGTNGNDFEIAIASIFMPAGIPSIVILATGVFGYAGANHVYLRKNGVVIASYAWGGAGTDYQQYTIPMTYQDVSQSGGTYDILIGGGISWSNVSVVGLGTKR